MTGFVMDLVELLLVYAIQYPLLVASAINAAICFVFSLPFLYIPFLIYPKIKEKVSPLILVPSLALFSWILFFTSADIIYFLTVPFRITSAILPLSLIGFLYTIPFLALGYLIMRFIERRFNLPAHISIGPTAYICWFIFWYFEILVKSPVL